MHEGHRKRMLERIKRAEEGFENHELLEVLLYNALPRVNTNEIAHELLQTFGSLRAVFNADVEQLTTVKGVGATTAEYLRCVGVCFQRASQEREKTTPRITSFSDIEKMAQSRFKNATTERIEIYGIDGKDTLSFVKSFVSEQTDKARVSAEELGKVIVANHPKSVVIAHNHLVGPCEPSPADDVFTKQMQMLCNLHGICLYDHVIVTPNGAYSYFLTGKLGDIQDKFSMDKIFGGEKR